MPTGRQGFFSLTLFLSVAYGFASFRVVTDYFRLDAFYDYNDYLSYGLLAPLGCLCGFIGATFVHELAHFFAAHLVGGHVHKIQIGSGKVLGTFRLMNTICQVNASLRSGLVFYSITSPHRTRLKMALVSAAAPLASLVLAGCSVTFLMLVYPFIKSSDSIWHYLFPFLVGGTSPCLLFLPGVLLPYRYEYAGRKMETDAMHLLTILRMTDVEIAKKTSDAQTLLTTLEEIDPSTTSLEEAVTRADAAPENLLALSTAAHLLRGANDPRALVYFEKLVNLNLAPAKRTYFLDLYLTCALEINAVTLHPDTMEKLSRELVASDPDDISKRGTLGSILVDLGRIEEGKAILHDVLEKTTGTIDKLYSHIFLALAAKQEGNLALASEHAQKAVEVDPTSPALKRITDLLPAKPEDEKN